MLSPTLQMQFPLSFLLYLMVVGSGLGRQSLREFTSIHTNTHTETCRHTYCGPGAPGKPLIWCIFPLGDFRLELPSCCPLLSLPKPNSLGGRPLGLGSEAPSLLSLGNGTRMKPLRSLPGRFIFKVIVISSRAAFFFFSSHEAYGILIPRPGIKSGPLAVRARRPHHWTEGTP